VLTDFSASIISDKEHQDNIHKQASGVYILLQESKLGNADQWNFRYFADISWCDQGNYDWHYPLRLLAR
jgi:hypothetical protein